MPNVMQKCVKNNREENFSLKEDAKKVVVLQEMWFYMTTVRKRIL